MFELLSQLDLPSFGPANWQSTIRSEVTVHVNYENLGEWHGYETADITYDDIQNKLVNLLAEKGYDKLQDRTQVNCPKCFIEVKTTTAEWDEPFYVSRAQYDRVSLENLHQSYVPTDELKDVPYAVGGKQALE